MNWFKVTVETTTEAVAAVSEILLANGANGVEVADAADTTHIKARFKDQVYDWQDIPHRHTGAAVTAYYPVNSNNAALVAKIRQQVTQLPAAGFSPDAAGIVDTAVIADEDWSVNWRQYYHPVRVTRFLTVVPEWTQYKPGQDEHIIRMNPGEAFGTGTHPTTQIALALLEQTLRGGETVIDVGTGSGILSIAAAEMGAVKITGTDVDERALAVARKNIQLNPAAAKVQLQTANLLADFAGRADIILANILTEVLVPLIPQLDAHLAANGAVILAGIYKDKMDVIAQSLKASGFAVTQVLTDQEWFGVVAKRESELQ